MPLTLLSIFHMYLIPGNCVERGRSVRLAVVLACLRTG